MSGKVLLLAPVLPADVLATARMLEKAEMLEALVTRGIPGSSLSRVLAKSAVSRSFSRREGSPVSRERSDARWSADLVFYSTLAATRSRILATDRSFSFLDALAAKSVVAPITAVLAREDCCLRTFARAKESGVATFYQLPTAYWRFVRELMGREIEQFPGICQAAEDPREFSSNRTDRKEAELQLADYVLCPSTFVRASLDRHGTEKTECIPFGIDRASSNPATISRKPMFLYAGNITMRKGVHRVLIAWKTLGAYRTHELRLVGDMFLSPEFLKDFSGMFTHVPRLSREELDRHYSEASAFVFNPVADGFGHVILEAMRSGVPVIASRNSGAPDTITDRVEGLLIDYGKQDQITGALEWSLSHPAELEEMGAAASQRAAKWTWDNYAERFLAWLRPLLSHG